MTLAEFHRLQHSAHAIVLPREDRTMAVRVSRPVARMALGRDQVFKLPKVAGVLIALRKTAKK